MTEPNSASAGAGATALAEAPVLEVTDLVKHFPIRGGLMGRRPIGYVQAVNGISLNVNRGQTVALVGESGCGKSTMARAVLRLIEPTSGSVLLDGVDVCSLQPRELRRARRDMQIVFQDPYASLNPRMTIRQILTEKYRLLGSEVTSSTISDLLDTVGLAEEYADRYPHEFSGGQRQRIGVARALALRPRLIVCDEPVSALDVSIQAQIVNLLEDLQDELGLTYLFIAHDLSVVRHIADRVAVMYLGHVVEIADRDDLFDRPHHPYTQALISAVPIPDPRLERQRERIVLRGDVPNPANPPSGCRFRTRCWKAQDICSQEEPPLVPHGSGGLVSACHFAEERQVL